MLLATLGASFVRKHAESETNIKSWLWKMNFKSRLWN